MKEKHYAIENLELMQEWDYELNKSLSITPENVTLGSHIAVNWICKECGFKWSTSIKNRTRKDGKATGCPKCGRKKLSLFHLTPIKGVNDLESIYPNIAKEWNYEKNRNLKPCDIVKGSSQKVWWKCHKCGNEWETQVCNRTGKNSTGCPICSAKKTGSDNAKPIVGVNDLKTLFPSLIEEWNYNKNENLPETYLPGSNKKVWWKCKNCGYEWQGSIVNRTRGRNCSKCLKEYHISYPEKAVFYYVKKLFPEAKENERLDILDGKELDIYIPNKRIGIEYDGYSWHQNSDKDLKKDLLCKNNNIELIRLREPNLPTITSDSIVYTLSKKSKNLDIEGAIIWLLIYLKCSNFDVNLERDNKEILKLMDLSKKKNSIVYEYPEDVKDWNYEKNEGLNPEYFTKGSEKVVWWKCHVCGCEWENKIKDKIKRKKCPNCIKDNLVIGKNDYETLYPKLIDDWDYKKNKIHLKQVKKSDNLKLFWWKCHVCGYEWELSIRSKIVSTYCPKCASKVGVDTRMKNYIKKHGSLASNYPEIVKEWNYEKNEGLSPEHLTSKNKRQVWWKCENGHEWMASICNRTKGFGRCHECENKKKIT